MSKVRQTLSRIQDSVGVLSGRVDGSRAPALFALGELTRGSVQALASRDRDAWDVSRKDWSRVKVGFHELFTDHRYPVGIPYCREFAPGFFRSSRFESVDEMRELVTRQGVRRIVQLTAETLPDEQFAEQLRAEGLDVEVKVIRILDNFHPSIDQVNEALEFLQDGGLIHCEAGAGRTGVMAAAIRCAFHGWELEDAILELRLHPRSFDPARRDELAQADDLIDTTPNQLRFLRGEFREALESGRIFRRASEAPAES